MSESGIAPQFQWTFAPSLPDARFILLNRTLIADPASFVTDTLLQLSASDAAAESFMYAGSTPQMRGRRSAYAGPMGDGRAAVIGTVLMASGAQWIVQAKGIRTPITEPPKDGLASVDDGVHELLVSEQLSALGSPSCRVLGLVSVPGRVKRRGCPAAQRVIVLRAAPQFWRCGTLEHLYYANDHEQLRAVVHSALLADSHAEPVQLDETAGIDGAAAETAEASWSLLDPGELHTWEDGREAVPEDITASIAFLRSAVDRMAVLAASWQAIGFVHGMLRSDNVLLCGAAIDLGPTSHFTQGDLEDLPRPKEPMYAFEQQPEAAAAHIKQLAITLSLLVPQTNQLEEEVRRFWPVFRAAEKNESIRSAESVTLDDDVTARLLSLTRACCVGDEEAMARVREDLAANLCQHPLLKTIVEMFS